MAMGIRAQSVSRARGDRRRLRALLCAAVGVVLAGVLAAGGLGGQGRAVAQSPPLRAATYRNPVFRPAFPDPAVLAVGHDYYAYGTTTAWEPPNHLFPILHSRDLIHWRYVADAMVDTPAWGVGDWWAPDVIAHNGAYYLYYVGKSLASNEHCVAVATARRPAGPFTPRRVIGCGDASGHGYIDPAALLDADGRAYLYFSVDSPYHSISVLPLSADLLHAAGPRKELFTVSQPWEYGSGSAGNTVEGPFAIEHRGVYDLFYSGSAWENTYGMGYATASSPLGPFTKSRRNPILRGTSGVVGPGGGSVVRGPDGRWWLVYHAWAGPGAHMADTRNLRIDPLSWKGDSISVRGPTTGVETAP